VTDHTAGLTDAEFQQMLALLRRHVSADMDQWECWRLETVYGPVFIRITRELPAGEPVTSYDRLPPPDLP
jgi:hypothetical protein